VIIELGKDYAFSEPSDHLRIVHLLAAMVHNPEPGVLLADCFGVTPEELRAALPRPVVPVRCSVRLPLEPALHALLQRALELAQRVPDRACPGLIDLQHLALATAASTEAAGILALTPVSIDDAGARLEAWRGRVTSTPNLRELTEHLRGLREELLGRVYGQDHAVSAFVEGLFAAEVVATADFDRRAPKGVFVFAGPPGVGKTLLAETGAARLGRPFKRFDMSAYSDHQAQSQLIGTPGAYSGARPGLLTEFVMKNPDAVLLFDEIEKAHVNTIHLFLQILDAGVLEDKFEEKSAAFRDTIIVFTTNAGKKLYDQPNSSGVYASNSAFRRQTILDALATEQDARTGQPFFPPAICSRMGTGYPIMFNHLRVNELERVADAELRRMAALFERQYYKRVTFHPWVPMCMVLREGARIEARTLRAQTESFVKTEVFRFCELFRAERLDEVFAQLDSLHITVADPETALDPEMQALFTTEETPRVLLAAGEELTSLYRRHITGIDWHAASTAQDALEVLASEDVDLVLIDIWLGTPPAPSSATVQQFDHIPLGARSLDRGQELLRAVRDRMPNVPVYLLSLDQHEVGPVAPLASDEELFRACVRGGGARGMVASRFVADTIDGWERDRDAFAEGLGRVCLQLHRERTADSLGQQRKVLSFDTVPWVDRERRAVELRLRSLRLGRAVSADDAGEIVSDVERPRTSFDDVIGADAAKDELRFFVEYLRNPRRFAALGLQPPKGVLLHGPPGTGKTMLARALAGESDVAFVATVATSFVTLWQGSGPQSIRDLFARARRYAPAVVFIDEIDAIGKARQGLAGAGAAEENTLNALLSEMDGFDSQGPERPVFVLAATNFLVDSGQEEDLSRPNAALDPALVRRFSRIVLVDLPDREARERYLELRLRGRPNCVVSDETIDAIARRAAGLTIAALESAVESAARAAARADAPLDDDMLEAAFRQCKVEQEERPQTRFDDVIGADSAKEELRFFVGYLRDPTRFAALGLQPPKGVLLHGPPGTGKTMLARAMAGESDVAFIPTVASSFVTGWQGSGPRSIRDLFARARRSAPSIVFIDEIDAVGKVRAGSGAAEENTLNALLTEMDGFTSPSPERPVFVLAATNFRVDARNADQPEQSARTLDPALVRRFSRTILVDPPDRAARERYLTLKFAGRSGCSVTTDAIALIAERSLGMTLANLDLIVETAAREAFRARTQLSDALLEAAFETQRFGEVRSRTPEAVRRTACHEAGHAILYWLAGFWPSYVTVVSRGRHGGYMDFSGEDRERQESQTREELLADIRACLGGRAAELLCYGAAGGLSTGASQDLAQATDQAKRMVCCYGMDDAYGLLASPELLQSEAALSSPAYLRVNRAASRILGEQMELAQQLLAQHRAHLDAVVAALAERERLGADDLRAILPEDRQPPGG